MNVWETDRGHRCADALIRNLPKIAKEVKQSVIKVTEENAESVKNCIDRGDFRFVGSYTVGGDTYIVVEK